jgi:hypothetical protein
MPKKLEVLPSYASRRDTYPIGYSEDGGQSYTIVGEVKTVCGDNTLACDLVAAYNRVYADGAANG